MRLVILGLVLGVGAAAADEGTKPPVRVTGAVETSILELDAVVADRHGKPVEGLTASDFEVLVGGKPVPIQNFYERRTDAARTAPLPEGEPGAAAANGPIDAAPVRQPRHVVLFVDRLQLIEKWKADASFGALRAVLDRTIVAPGDDAMIVTWNRSIGTVIPFTSDLAAIRRVLDREEKLCRRPLEADSERRRLEDEAAWFETLPKTSVSSGVEVSQRAAAAEALAQMRAKANALKAVFAVLGGLPGRKIVVHASHRFSRLAGLEFNLIGPVSYGEIPSQAREFDAQTILDSVVAAANANGVTVYTLFPPGFPDNAMVVTADSSFTRNPKINSPLEGARGDMIVQNEADALEPVALQTGGTFTLGYKSAPEFAPRIVADLERGYSLGVEPPAGASGKTLAVKVKTKDPALTVRVRRSVVVKTTAERVRDRVLSNLFRPESLSRLPIALASARTETAKGKTVVSLSLKIPVDRLARVPAPHGEAGTFSVLVASAGSDGSFSEVTRQRQPFELPRDDPRTPERLFSYELPVVVASREARISVCVWDEVGREAGFLLVDVRDGHASTRR